MTSKTVKFNKIYDRKDFECSNERLNDYIKKQASQDIKKNISSCFVYTEIEDDKHKIKGYYTLSNSSIHKNSIPENLRKKFPYESLPVTLLGRLAVDKSIKGQGLGKKLLLDALLRSLLATKEIGSFAVVVEPIDDDAVSFYEKFGFEKLLDKKEMFLPMKTISLIFS